VYSRLHIVLYDWSGAIAIVYFKDFPEGISPNSHTQMYVSLWKNVYVVPLINGRGHAVVEALRYKPEGRGIDSRWYHWNFYWHIPSGRTMALGLIQPLREMSTRNISWGKGGGCVGLTTLPPSCAVCLKIWEPEPPGTLRACQGL
jgi:hypothetical protein